jgi:hypothetical protein
VIPPAWYDLVVPPFLPRAVVLAAVLALSTGSASAEAIPAVGVDAAMDLGARWEEAVRLEVAGDLLGSAARFAEIAALAPERGDVCWRAARNHWRFGERSLLARRGDSGHYRAAEIWASRGLERDPACGACALWKYAAMGRLAQERGLLWAARHMDEMRDLLELGLSLRPADRDSNGNVTMANLHYAAAVFYRMIPEGFWLGMLLGVRGDPERSLRHIREALAISPGRVDYSVEQGAILLCLGDRRGNQERTSEGLAALERSLSLPELLETESIDKAYARVLLREPGKACGFTRVGFMNLEGEWSELADDYRSGRELRGGISFQEIDGAGAGDPPAGPAAGPRSP